MEWTRLTMPAAFYKKRPVKRKRRFRRNNMTKGESNGIVSFFRGKLFSLIRLHPLKVSHTWERPKGKGGTHFKNKGSIFSKIVFFFFMYVDKVCWLRVCYLESDYQSSNPCLGIRWLWAWSFIHSLILSTFSVPVTEQERWDLCLLELTY